MWYKIERNLNSFIISNTGSKDLYLTLFLSEKCDIDVNYEVCIEEVIIKVGDNSLNPLPLGSINMFLDDELNPLKTTVRSISKKDKYDKNKNLIHSKNSLT